MCACCGLGTALLPTQAREGDSRRASAHSHVAKPAQHRTAAWKGWWYLGRSTVSIGELKPQSLAFRGWNDTRSHQLGSQPGFMFLLTLEPLYWVFTRLLRLAKARLCSHSWLSLTDPGELLNNLWGVCQLDRKELPWISPFFVCSVAVAPSSNHSRN